MIIVFIFEPGILLGTIALALHNFGILGKDFMNRVSLIGDYIALIRDTIIYFNV